MVGVSESVHGNDGLVSDAPAVVEENRQADAITAWINFQRSPKTVENCCLDSGMMDEHEQISSHRFGGGCC